MNLPTKGISRLTRNLANRRYTSTLAEPATASLNPRWLSDVKTRIGYCMTWGLDSQQKQEAGAILQEIARDWRELIAGSEGFLTDASRRSIFRREVVWGEMDSMGHVNNVVYNRYAESGRVNWARNYAKFIDPAYAKAWGELWTPKGEGLLLRKITTEFKFPMTYPDHVTVYHKLVKEPTESTQTFEMQVIVLSELHQRPAARLNEENVLYDYRKAAKIPLRPFMLDVLLQTWKLQEKAKQINSERVWTILDRVRHLEQSSWDRDGAVEDMGGTGL